MLKVNVSDQFKRRLNQIYNLQSLEQHFFSFLKKKRREGAGDAMAAPLGFIRSDERSEERLDQCEYMNLREII